MLMLLFGKRYLVTTSLGRETERGDFSLHIQCAWRVVREDEILIGLFDYLSVDKKDPGWAEESRAVGAGDRPRKRLKLKKLRRELPNGPGRAVGHAE